jgi:protein involved in polysaccharide export with SLBB domain
LNKIYSGINGEDPTSDIKVTLGQIRTIQINVMGEVAVPGTYSLSSFSTVFHALYRAGGIGRLGSLRNIYLMRNGRKVATFDVYDFLLKGKSLDDIRLQEGDVVMVPPYDMLVDISGNVKRPMYYEMKNGETVKNLIDYAGYFTGDAYTRNVRMVRQNGKEYQVYTIDDIDYSVFKLMDGDVVTVSAMLDRFENRVEVKGAVYRPGVYQFSGKLNTVRQLVEKADGLMAEAFTNRAVLHRQHEDLTREIIPVDIRGVLDGSQPDIALMRNDVLYIPSIHDLEDLGSLTIHGEVARPGTYAFAENTTLEDLIIQAGGLLESASTVRVDISRRVKDSKSTKATSVIGETYSFSLKDGFVIDGTPGFVLQPYDQIMVRRSPGYQAQINVTVGGEVEFGGTYSLTQRVERLSDLVKKAGGLTDFAYAKGARLTRVINAEERRRMNDVLRMSNLEYGLLLM